MKVFTTSNLERWFDEFDRECFHILFLNDFKTNLGNHCELFKFLNLERNSIEIKNEIVNSVSKQVLPNDELLTTILNDYYILELLKNQTSY